jgi:hypothetical protein
MSKRMRSDGPALRHPGRNPIHSNRDGVRAHSFTQLVGASRHVWYLARTSPVPSESN